MRRHPAIARSRAVVGFAGLRAAEPREYADLRVAPEVLSGGRWAVVAEFDGPWHAWRFDSVNRATPPPPVSTITSAAALPGPASWTTSLTRTEYVAAVAATVAAIRAGRLMQVNVGRILSRPCADRPSAAAMHAFLHARHEAPYGGWLDVPPGSAGPADPGGWLTSASPELAIEVDQGRITARPIKGTAAAPAGLLEKDHVENSLVAAAVARDLAPICRPGGVRVEPAALEHHPGLVHLAAGVTGELGGGAPTWEGWAEILAAVHPPRSVAGVPRTASLDWIARTEAGPRGPYCGQFGWIDADAGRAVLAAGIRIFWHRAGRLHYGTGAGITAASSPAGEWTETELKAERLIRLADEFLAGEAAEAGPPLG